jgi:hypothetical protein
MDSERYTAHLLPPAGASIPDTRRAPAPVPTEAELVQRFRERLCLFAARRLRDAAVAEDAAQETLRRVLEALRAGRVENLVALPAFVFATARHVCQQQARSLGREDRALHRLHGAGAAPASPDPLLVLVSEERRAAEREAPLRGPRVALPVRIEAAPGALVAAWPSTPEADAYRVRLFGAEGALLLQRETPDTILHLDPGSLAASGDRLYLEVAALDELRQVLAGSGLREVPHPRDAP